MQADATVARHSTTQLDAAPHSSTANDKRAGRVAR